MSSTASALIILVAITATYLLARLFRLSTELSLFSAALSGAIIGGYGIPARHLAEGAMTYLDICLIFLTATLFMNLLQAAGGVAFAVRAILQKFYRRKFILFLLLTLLLLIPGALTGAGSITVLITGSLVAVVLRYMGLPDIKIAAIIFIIAGLSAAAPPVSLWAMLTAAGINMPYVGFFLPLLIPCLLGALFTIFILGWKAQPVDLEKALAEIPVPPEKMNWWRLGLPFLVFLALILAGRIFPFSFPILGLPLIFALTALTAYWLSPVRLNLWKISLKTADQLLPLIGTLTCVGILIQIMTLTGVRGLISVSVVTLPAIIVIATLFLTLPVSEAVLMWGAAPVLGVPLALLFNTRGMNPIVALAGMSLIWPLGDALPPTAIIGRLTMEVVGTRKSYYQFLKQCLIPGALIILLGMLMVIFSHKLSFLTVF
ncbi:MAG: C4-dicarboxylate ABC transporter [Candidatus Saccharicenans sp.]|nr:MAG: C4-dicarboxylate ABC transporter [Candidatus Aminicenantes bacterium]HEK86785.1 C4-dicarboxylate ABC transporter [Candidatus Aminicenantes bacterium]